MKYFLKYCLCIALIGAVSCNELNDPEPPEQPDNPGVVDFLPEFDYEIGEWNGETATDATNDITGTNADYYHEANTFSSVVTITYDGGTAIVENSNAGIVCHTTGAYVTVDLLTNSVSCAEIVIKGKSDEGGLKIYGKKSFKLTMQGVELTSKIGPAINNQCKKSMFVHLVEGTVNSLTDASTYSNDTYYSNPSVEEDRKGCLFSEGGMIFSGTGVLKVAGKYNHAVVTDDIFVMRPGTTIVIPEAANNGLHVKGNLKSGLGIKIMGGLIYANVASPAGKAIKCDLEIDVEGGQLLLNTSGDGEYNSIELDTSSAACIKTDANVTISGGNHILKSTGLGGKGINATGSIIINGGNTTVSSSGIEYVYNERYSSSPKAVKAGGNITINSGIINVSAAGESDSAEGLDCAGILTLNGGETYVHAYDDAVNITTAINIYDGKIYAYSLTKDGIDTNGVLTINGGTAIGIGASNQKSGINVMDSNNFVVNGGTVISLGGALQSEQSSASAQYGVKCIDIEAESCETLSAVDNNQKVIFSLKLPRDFNKEVVYFSTSSVTNENNYSLTTEIVPTSTTSWCGLAIE